MLRRTVYSFVLIATVSVACAWGQSTFDIPRLDGILIDGDPAEWGDRGFRVDLVADERGQIRAVQAGDVRFRLGWDERGLLILLKVQRNIFAEHPSIDRLWAGSCVELYMAGAVGSAELCNFNISPGMDPKYPEPRVKAYDFRNATKTDEVPSITFVRRITAQGLVMEALMPWKNLDIQPEVSRELAFQLVVDHVERIRDRDPNRYRAMWFPYWYPADGSATKTHKMHGLRLAEQTVDFAPIAAAGHQVSWFPRVQVAAPLPMAGKPVEVRQGETVLATGMMVRDDDRAFAELSWPHASPATAPGKVDVVLDGRAISKFDMPAAKLSMLSRVYRIGRMPTGYAPPDSSFPLLEIEQLPRPAAGEKTGICVIPSPEGDAFASAPTDIQVLSLGGEEVASATGTLSNTVELPLPDGLFRVRAAVPAIPIRAEAPCLVGDDPASAIKLLTTSALELQSVPKYAGCRGWIRFALSELEAALAAGDVETPTTLDLALRLGEWMEASKLSENPLASLRELTQWAYLSEADGTGQPFVVGIPQDYDPAQSYGLTVDMHGSGGSACSFGGPYGGPAFLLSVTGRARSGGYAGLMEADVLDATRYVMEHWSIDPDRVCLTGESMGGGGTFWIGSRHPDLFAACRPVCGYGIFSPVENLLHVPVYAVHSRDDYRVIIANARAPIRRISEGGGLAVCDETDGAGHSVSAEYPEGMQRSKEWMERQRRPREVRHIRYTALDESARGAYWVEVTEWGPEGRPAYVEAGLDNGNDLYLNLDNVAVLRVMLNKSPVDRAKPMMVSVNHEITESLSPPLPEDLYILAKVDGWEATANKPPMPPRRLHFPGGAMALFHGEPIMVVWGTGGSEDIRKAVFSAAQAARRSPTPYWPTDGSKIEGIPIAYNRFGMLPGKPDTEVTPEDMARHNLILIGTADQNSVVARLADRLPVRVAADQVAASDGFSWPFAGRAMGLLSYNPEEPRRLIYWVASESPEFYKPGAMLMRTQSYGTPCDFILMGLDDTRVAARRFDSRWNWEAGYGDSPILPAESCTAAGFAAAYGEALRRETGADFAFAHKATASDSPVWTPGQTRVMDVATVEYDNHVFLFDLSGQEIMDYAAQFNNGSFQPESRLAALQPDRNYRISLSYWDMNAYVLPARHNPESFRILNCTIREALRHHMSDAALPGN